MPRRSGIHRKNNKSRPPSGFFTKIKKRNGLAQYVRLLPHLSVSTKSQAGFYGFVNDKSPIRPILRTRALKTPICRGGHGVLMNTNLSFLKANAYEASQRPAHTEACSSAAAVRRHHVLCTVPESLDTVLSGTYGFSHSFLSRFVIYH